MVKLGAIRNKKGFTMIELIVVLIILAVMAAFLIPSYIGFVNEANDKQDLASARAGLLAAQIMATEGNTMAQINADIALASGSRFGALTQGIEGTFSVTGLDTTDRQITGFTYRREAGSVLWTYNGSTWSKS